MFLPARPCPSPSCPPKHPCLSVSVCLSVFPARPFPGCVRPGCAPPSSHAPRPTLLSWAHGSHPLCPPNPYPTPIPNQSHTGDKMDRVIYGKGEGAYTSGTKKKMHSARY